MVLTSLSLKKIMSNVIRKISIGSDYKNDAMHYAVGQQVYGGHEISHILYDEEKDSLYPNMVMVYKNKRLVPYDYYSELMNTTIKNGIDVCGRALRDRKSIHLKKLDKKIYKGIVDQKIGMKINSIVSIPIIIQDNIFGVIEVANRKNSRKLDEFDYRVVSIISKLAISKMEQSQLLDWAITDNLTKLFNFHYYQILLEQGLNQAKSRPEDMSIVIIDLL